MLRVLFLSLISISSLANESICWKSEINPTSQKVYTSSSSYQNHLNQWKLNKPKVPNLFYMGLAYMTYEKEKKTSLSLGSDKQAHCYMGCRIAQETNYSTALYVGWYKEHKDLLDCQKPTHFEPLDFEATKLGAQAATNNINCIEFCMANSAQF